MLGLKQDVYIHANYTHKNPELCSSKAVFLAYFNVSNQNILGVIEYSHLTKILQKKFRYVRFLTREECTQDSFTKPIEVAQ